MYIYMCVYIIDYSMGLDIAIWKSWCFCYHCNMCDENLPNSTTIPKSIIQRSDECS